MTVKVHRRKNPRIAFTTQVSFCLWTWFQFPDDGETDPLELVFQTLLVCFGLLTIDVVEKQPTFASRPLVKKTAAQMSEMSAANNTSNKNLLIVRQGSTKTIQSLHSFPGPVGLMNSYTLLEHQMSLAFVASCGLPPVKIEVKGFQRFFQSVLAAFLSTSLEALGLQ